MSATCIVLAGGLGTRLQSVLVDKPKSLAPVDGAPFIERQISSLAKRGVNKFLISLGFGADQVIDSIAEWGAPYKISYVTEAQPLGTGGAIRYAMNSFNLDEALVVNGDTFLTGALNEMLEPLNSFKNEEVRCGLIYVPDRARYGGVEISSEGLVTQFFEKGCTGGGLINAGIYRVGINIFEGVDATAFSFETEVLPSLCNQRRLSGAVLGGKFIDIGVPEDYKLFCDQYQEFV
jgi:D-glycero-alpha-D-manno-heptose 1-phosphate guanylyltransferase